MRMCFACPAMRSTNSSCRRSSSSGWKRDSKEGAILDALISCVSSTLVVAVSKFRELSRLAFISLPAHECRLVVLFRESPVQDKDEIATTSNPVKELISPIAAMR